MEAPTLRPMALVIGDSTGLNDFAHGILSAREMVPVATSGLPG